MDRLKAGIVIPLLETWRPGWTSTLKKGSASGPMRRSPPCALGNRVGGDAKKSKGTSSWSRRPAKFGTFRLARPALKPPRSLPLGRRRFTCCISALMPARSRPGALSKRKPSVPAWKPVTSKVLPPSSMVALCAPIPFASIEPPWIVKSKRSRNRIEVWPKVTAPGLMQSCESSSGNSVASAHREHVGGHGVEIDRAGGGAQVARGPQLDRHAGEPDRPAVEGREQAVDAPEGLMEDAADVGQEQVREREGLVEGPVGRDGSAVAEPDALALGRARVLAHAQEVDARRGHGAEPGHIEHDHGRPEQWRPSASRG